MKRLRILPPLCLALLVACASTEPDGGPGIGPGGYPDEPAEAAPEGTSAGAATAPTTTAAPAAAAKTIASVLADFESRLEVKPFRVSIGNLSYQDTGVPGDFTGYLMSRLTTELARAEPFEEYARKDLDHLLEEQQLSVSDLVDREDAPEVGQLKGVHGLIVGEYWEGEGSVRTSLRLLDIQTGKILGAETIEIPRSRLPAKLEVAPRELERTSSALASFSEGHGRNEFKIKLWVDRGHGGVYTVGEDLLVKFRTDVDCYVRLYHLGANDELQMIYPNQWSGNGLVRAGAVHTIPEDDTFRFALSLPLGTELIYASASTVPFAEPMQSFQTLGGTRDIGAVRTRGLKVTAGNARLAEATCVYSIIE